MRACRRFRGPRPSPNCSDNWPPRTDSSNSSKPPSSDIVKPPKPPPPPGQTRRKPGQPGHPWHLRVLFPREMVAAASTDYP